MARTFTGRPKAPAKRTAVEPANVPTAKLLWVGDVEERRRRAERARQERMVARTENPKAIQRELDAGPIYSGRDLMSIARRLRETAQAMRNSSPFAMYCQRAAVLAATAIRCGVLDGAEYTTARSAILGGFTSFAYAVAEVVKLATTNPQREPEIAACEWLAGVVEAAVASRLNDTPVRKLPPLKKWAFEAWKLRQFGMTVTAIASELAEKHKDPRITQPRVSEQIQLAQMHAEASGLAVDAAKALPTPGSRTPARSIDPRAAEQGRRTDGKAHYLREKERQKARFDDEGE